MYRSFRSPERRGRRFSDRIIRYSRLLLVREIKVEKRIRTDARPLLVHHRERCVLRPIYRLPREPSYIDVLRVTSNYRSSQAAICAHLHRYLGMSAGCRRALRCLTGNRCQYVRFAPTPPSPRFLRRGEEAPWERKSHAREIPRFLTALGRNDDIGTPLSFFAPARRRRRPRTELEGRKSRSC